LFVDPFFFAGGGGLPAVVNIFVVSALLVGVFAILFAGRSDDDRNAERPVARYLSALGLFTLFISLFAAFGTVHALTDLVVDHQARFDDLNEYYESDSPEGTTTVIPVQDPIYDFSSETTNNGNYAVAVASGLVTFTVGGIFFLHRRWRRRLFTGRAGAVDALTRIDHTYHASRCFVSALVVAVAITAAGFAVFEIAAPGIAIGGNAKVARGEGMSELMSFSALGLAAALIFIRSWNQLSPALGRSRARSR
jgi:hypothetical protein